MTNSPYIIANLPVYQVLVLLYVGPDQVMPLLSVLGAVVGVVLMWWRRLSMMTVRIFKFITTKREVSPRNSK